MNESSTAAAPELPGPPRRRHDPISFLTISCSHSNRTSVLTLLVMMPHVPNGAFIVGVPPTTKSLAINSVHEPRAGLPWSAISVEAVYTTPFRLTPDPPARVLLPGWRPPV